MLMIHSRPGIIGTGYGDGDFHWACQSCYLNIDKELLSLAKFVKDTELLLTKNLPMPGTILEPKTGMPDPMSANDILRRMHPLTFPNRMIQYVLRIRVRELIKRGVHTRPTMEDVRKLVEATLASQDAVKLCDSTQGVRRYTPNQTARVAVRKMMARYWENFSSFALDLGGAVVRQGIFTEKMVKMDWLHSPSAHDTMKRLIVKYGRFLTIMGAYPEQVAVPTLDVDLAWHTHQLSPAAYYKLTVSKCRKFIDHDDKIAEDKLSTSFEWTSKVYQERYGEVYSECTCWYCECEFCWL